MNVEDESRQQIPRAAFPNAIRESFVVNNYTFGVPSFVSTSSLSEERQVTPCQAVRMWRNQSDGKRDRTISVAVPGDLPEFPADATITVFVADDNHSGKPPEGSNPTTVGRFGDSISKTVPIGKAVFVHVDRRGTTTPVRAVLAQSP